MGDAAGLGPALILEDNAILALDAADMLGDAGFAPVHNCGTLAEAMALIEAGVALRVALLDVNLGTETSRPAAEALAERGIPFLLTTGYESGDEGLDGFPDAPLLAKPYAAGTLRARLEALVG